MKPDRRFIDLADWDGENMKSIKNWMLGAAVVAGALGLGATTAQAAQIGIYARGPVAYVPPSPGPGYVWAAGYMDDGYWIPGRWNFVGYRGGYGYGGYAYVGRDRDRGWDGDRYRDRDRDFDHRDRDRDRDRDHDRDRHDRR
jgi:hypothetical protein